MIRKMGQRLVVGTKRKTCLEYYSFAGTKFEGVVLEVLYHKIYCTKPGLKGMSEQVQRAEVERGLWREFKSYERTSSSTSPSTGEGDADTSSDALDVSTSSANL